MAQYATFAFPAQSLYEGKCLAFCPEGYATVNGICQACESPCATCRSDVSRCLSCSQEEDNDQKYLFGRACRETCPAGTVLNDTAKECTACVSGCETCKLTDTNACLKCSFPLLLLDNNCYAQCPLGYRANFWRTQCYLDEPIKVVYMPWSMLAALILVVCIAGKWSSKNLFGQHRILLSFYSLAGVIDVLVIWTQVVFTILQGEAWQLIVPAIALAAYYYLNFCYVKLWNELDPPKPKDEDYLSLNEVILINSCDQHFDLWNQKYFKVAKYIKRGVALVSHKLFQLPFTHFYGYLHLTVRIQDH